jgi:hypothetical protein
MEKNNSVWFYTLTVAATFFLSLISFETFSQNTLNKRLVYEWSAPDGQANFPVVLVLGGAEGGLTYAQKWAEVLTKKGFGVMALAYFGSEGLKKQLEEIPLEYFQRALDSLKTFQGVMMDKIAIISISKGTEAALLLASDNRSIRLVVAASPSHVVWQGINRADYSSIKSSWIKNGKPLPFVHYDYSKGYYPIINFYLGALDKPIDEQTIIPVENSNARIVLFSGGQDQIWPSSLMSEAIKKRLKLKNHDEQLLSYNYPNAGHGFLIPYQTSDEKKEILKGITEKISFVGGSIEAFDEAMIKSNETVINELLMLKNVDK